MSEAEYCFCMISLSISAAQLVSKVSYILLCTTVGRSRDENNRALERYGTDGGVSLAVGGCCSG